jgi:hypothetical protein
MATPRVYTLLVALALVVGAAVTAADSQAPGRPLDLSINPAMAKGPAGAPVVIVEFSDYQ